MGDAGTEISHDSGAEAIAITSYMWGIRLLYLQNAKNMGDANQLIGVGSHPFDG